MRTTQVLVARALSCFPQTLSQTLTQFSQLSLCGPRRSPRYELPHSSCLPCCSPVGRPPWAPQCAAVFQWAKCSKCSSAHCHCSSNSKCSSSKCRLRPSKSAGHNTSSSSSSSKSNQDSSNPNCKHSFSLPHPGHVRASPSAATSRTESGPTKTAPCIFAQGPDWAWLKDVTPAYLFEVAFYKFCRQRATAIAKIPDGAVKPCWHDESITGHWCILANLLNPSVPTQEGQAAYGHCKVEEYELLFSCWASYGWGHVRTHTPPGATAKTVHHFYFNKDPPSFINATDAGAMAFKNECASVRSAGASLLRGSAKKGASAARALATRAKVATTAVKDEEQPQQQALASKCSNSSSSNSRQPCRRQHCSCSSSSSSGCRWPSNSNNNNNNNNDRHRHRYALCLPLRVLSTLLRALRPHRLSYCHVGGQLRAAPAPGIPQRAVDDQRALGHCRAVQACGRLA